MDVSTEAATNDLALLKPRQSLQNMGEKKDEDKNEQQGFQAFGPDGFTFLDFLDIINPLQHIPVISTLYREMTGDSIDPGSQIAGGTLFGGPIGAVAATTNVVLRENTGKDMGDHIMALINGEDDAGAAPVQLANGPVEPANPAASASLSPVLANMEVLEWARRETALMAGTPIPAAVPATAQNPGIRPPEDTRSLTVENKNIPGTSVLEPYQIAANTEVLDWARAEALLNTPARHEEAQLQEQQRNVIEDTGHQKRVASGLTQQQLSGATAPSGGWFSETMLLALASYQESVGLVPRGSPASRTMTEIGEADLRPDD